jgi:predicted nucleotidyltransferase
MLIAGIISEYNPFHNGHAYHIAQTRQKGAQAVVVVMSGNFVQRAEPALLSKRSRAEAAVRCGADLVIEMPLPWCSGNAQSFARGGVSLLRALGCVDILSFGSESGDAELLADAVKAVNLPETKAVLKQKLGEGLPFAAARETAVREASGDDAASVLASPNDTLAVEYILESQKQKCRFEFLAVKRFGAFHDSDLNGKTGFASASHIRRLIKSGDGWEKFVPGESAEVISREISRGAAPSDYKKLETAVLVSLRGATPEALKAFPDISEGLENRIISAARSSATLEELFDSAKTKRYSHARIRRVVLHSFLGVSAYLQSGTPPYLRVLVLNGRGREILKAAKSTASVPIVTKPQEIACLDSYANSIFSTECAASDIFELSLPVPGPCGGEFTGQIYYGV